MEFWLSYNNGAEKLRLPVPPSKFEVEIGNNIITVNINSLGELALIGKSKLSGMTLESFFPATQYSFCQYTDFPAPYACVATIKRWKDTGKPIRLTITETDINMAVCVESFKYGEQDGTGDVYFTLGLKEYRFVTATTTQAGSTSKTSRPTTKTPPKEYIVKSGDSLWAIAKKIYGDGSKYTQIASKNGINNPNTIKVGQKLVI